jgi:hypothetical protein
VREPTKSSLDQRRFLPANALLCSKVAHLLPKTQHRQKDYSADVRFYSTSPMNGERAQVAPGNGAADAQGTRGRRNNGPEFPIDRYRTLPEAAPDAMVIVNRSWEIVLLNIHRERPC